MTYKKTFFKMLGRIAKIVIYKQKNQLYAGFILTVRKTKGKNNGKNLTNLNFNMLLNSIA